MSEGSTADQALVHLDSCLPQVNRAWVLAKRPTTQIEEDTFSLEEQAVPEPDDGEFVVRVCYLSLAPVMRSYVIDGGVVEDPLPIGATMMGRGVGYVINSRHPDFDVGDVVHGPFGWQEYACSDGTGRVFKMKAWGKSISSGLGVLGLTGFTAYFGLFDKGKPQPGENVLVSGAVGGVGSVVGQLARIGGARPVAICGSDKKCRLAVAKLGYAAAINYRTENVAERVAELFSNGIDVYFDNVGGDILETAIDNMAENGRIVICGAISQYTSEDGRKYGPSNYFEMVYKNVSMNGFHIYSYKDRYSEAEARMASWMDEGQLVGLEDGMQGLEQMPAALIGLFSGANIGKRIVKIAEEPAR